MNVLSKASNVVVVCVTILIVAAMTGVTVLVALGHTSDDITRLINTIMNGLAIVSGAGAWIYSSASAQGTHNVEQKLNGGLDKRIQDAVTNALNASEVNKRGDGTGV